jgi:hypothetical protein
MIKVLELVEKERIKIKVTDTIDWHDIGDVHKRMESRKTTGKIVLIIPEKEKPTDNEEVKKEDVKKEEEKNIEEELKE